MLILGSGGLHIGQAGEFDYSGTQVAFIAMIVVLFCDLITNTHPLSRQSRRWKRRGSTLWWSTPMLQLFRFLDSTLQTIPLEVRKINHDANRNNANDDNHRSPHPNSDKQGPGGQGLPAPCNTRLCRAGHALYFMFCTSWPVFIKRNSESLTFWFFPKLKRECCEGHIFPFLLHLCRELQTAPFWGQAHCSLFRTQKYFTSKSFWPPPPLPPFPLSDLHFQSLGCYFTAVLCQLSFQSKYFARWGKKAFFIFMHMFKKSWVNYILGK